MSRSLIAAALLAAVAGTAFAAGQTTPPAPPAPNPMMHPGHTDAERAQMRANWQARRAEMQKKHFAEMDANHDGRISRDEMRTGMAKREAEMQQKRAGMFDAHFKMMDANGDGYISADEMAAAHARMGGMRGRHGMGMKGMDMKGMDRPMTPPPAR